MKRIISILLSALLLLFAVPVFADGEVLQAGLYVSKFGEEILYLDKAGVGVLNCDKDGMLSASGVVWTEDSLEIERVAVSFAIREGALRFIQEGVVKTFYYLEEGDTFRMGDREDTAYAGNYVSEGGQKLSLTADGRGVYTNASGEKEVFWGLKRPYWKGLENRLPEGACYVLFDSYLCDLTIAEESAVLRTENEGNLTFVPEVLTVEEPAVMTLVSSAFGFTVTLPADNWTVADTENGLLVSRETDGVQYTFLSLPLEGEPTAATLDVYADHIWTDSLMNAGVAYDPEDTERTDLAVGEIAGRRLATEWTQDEQLLKGDSALWYADGRLYVALCVSNEETREGALVLLDGAIASLRPMEEEEEPVVNQLPVDREVFESIVDLPEAEAPAEEPEETKEEPAEPVAEEKPEEPVAEEKPEEPAAEEKPEVESSAAGSLVGSWTLTKAVTMGVETPASAMDTSRTLVLNEDGSAVLLTDGSPMELEWTLLEGGKVSLTDAGVEQYVLTYDGAALILSAGLEGGMDLIFEKDV